MDTSKRFTEGFSVNLTPRPRRVAFVVPENEHTDAILDEICDFNAQSWGGRFNPIVFGDASGINPVFWSLLEVVSPDVIYSFSDLDDAGLEEIDRRLAPHKIQRHPNHSINGKPVFVVSLRNQATIEGALLNLRSLPSGWFGTRRDSTYLTFNHDRNDKVGRFARRVFGDSFLAYKLFRDQSSFGVVPSDTSDLGVLRFLAANRSCFTAMEIATRAPLLTRANYEQWPPEFILCVGDSPWNFVYAWNQVHFRTTAENLYKPSLHEMWIPSWLAGDEESRALAELLRTRMSYDSQHQHLKLLSFDRIEQSQLRKIGEKLSTESRIPFAWGTVEVREPPYFPPCSAATVYPLASQKRESEHQYVRGNEFYLDLNPPQDVVTHPDQTWMVDLRISDPAQERRYVNSEPALWKFPVRSAVANVLVKPSRVNRAGDISAKVRSQQQNIYVKLPDVLSVFQLLLNDAVQLHSGADQRKPRIRNYGLRTGDKGKYFKGILSLFGSVMECAGHFEHPFWRKIFEDLSKPEISEQLRAVVRDRIRGLRIKGPLSDEEMESLSSEVFKIASATQRPELTISLKQLLDRYVEYLNGLSAETRSQVLYRYSSVESDNPTQEQMRTAARKYLTGALADLVAKEIAQQGAEVRCDKCIAKFWYHVDELQQKIQCKGCRSSLSLTAEPPWRYRLNELVVRGIRDHGIVPVMRTIGRVLDQRSEPSFLFAAGLELWDYASEKARPVFEIDLAWTKDTEFGLADVKTSLIRPKELERLSKLCRHARPDVVILSSPGTATDKLLNRAESLREQVGLKNINCWGESEFRRAPSYVWFE